MERSGWNPFQEKDQPSVCYSEEPPGDCSRRLPPTGGLGVNKQEVFASDFGALGGNLDHRWDAADLVAVKNQVRKIAQTQSVGAVEIAQDRGSDCAVCRRRSLRLNSNHDGRALMVFFTWSPARPAARSENSRN